MAELPVGKVELGVSVEHFPIAGRFAIARGAKTVAEVVVATISGAGVRGRGECVPYARYGETIPSVIAAIESVRSRLEFEPSRAALQDWLPAGAARNALDCALWDWDARRDDRPAYAAAGLDCLHPVTTAFTISVDTPEAMAAAAGRAASRPLLKVKLAGAGDAERLRAVRAVAPRSTLIVDANEAWQPSDLGPLMAVCVECGVALIEQPLPAGADAALAGVKRPVPVCADESVHARAGLAELRDRYDAVNIKLDKTGGLTEALATMTAARAVGFELMVGCMVGTSLSMAPALIAAQGARYVDLDGPLLLAADRPHGLRYEGSVLHPPDPTFWG